MVYKNWLIISYPRYNLPFRRILIFSLEGIAKEPVESVATRQIRGGASKRLSRRITSHGETVKSRVTDQFNLDGEVWKVSDGI